MKKGSKQTEKARIKMGLAQKKRFSKNPSWNKGKKMSEEHRMKLSLAHKGLPSPKKGIKTGKHSWNFGKHPSSETLSKLRQSQKKRFEKETIWNKGIPMGEELRKKSSEAHKGQNAWNKGKTGIYSEETKIKIGLAGKGRTPWNKGKNKIYSEETIKKMSFAHKNMSDETKRKIGLVAKGRKLSEEHKRILLKVLTGRKVSEETKRKIALAQIGEKSYQWRGGISFEPYPTDWTNTLKRAIRIRDDNTCQLCFLKQGNIVHHIDYNKKNCNPENLITLCKSCHSKTNSNREKWKKFWLRKRRFK